MAKKTNLTRSLVMAVILLGFGCATAAADVIYVDTDAPPGGNGQTWGTAYKYLQDALDDAVADDDIWVAEGTYNPDDDDANDPNGSGLRTDTFQLINGVSIYGGFAGGESSIDERDWQTNETILSGDLDGNDVGDANRGENSYHVVTGSGTDANAVLDGFTITAGNADGSAPYDRGGGMYNYQGRPTVTKCTFTSNSASSYSGGMYNEDSNTTVTHCTFTGNSAAGGGGIFNWSSSPTVTDCTFSGNSAAQNGGGMYNHDNSSPTVTNCTFSSNEVVDGHGGGMVNSASTPTLSNCTFSGNSAGDGGGIYNFDHSSPTLSNCILWANTAPSGAQIYNDGTSSATVSYSDVEGSWGGTGNINADPCFVDADGPDNTVGTEDDNLRLLLGSPCIDAGDNTAVPGGVTTDLDGNPRFVDDPGTADTGNGTAPIVDMGAYEYGRSIFVDADATGANDGTSWEDAYKYLQDALAVAGTDDQIWVAEGTYKPDANTANPGGTGQREATFQLISGVAIYGGFAGYGAADPNERDIELYETILSGDLDGNDVQVSDPCDLLTEPTRGENSYHVVTGSGTDHNAVLDGFTITAGNADGADSNSEGGGMRNYLGGPTVANCTFSENSAADAAGGMDNDSGDAIVINCTFSRNSAAYDGGGMVNDNYVFQGDSPTVTNCTFNDNLARWGGGMSNYDDSCTIVSNCIFRNNSAKERGGGIDNDISTPTMINCIFIGNSAYQGGGMDSSNSSPTVTNCTFSGNIADANGGGMYNKSSSSPMVTNCILWGNTAPSGPQIYNDGTSSATVSYSDVEGSWGGTENIDEDPLFIDANGLDGIPGTADDEEGYVHLRGYSPCINAGDPGGNYSGQVDVDNQPRVAYGRVDMGADEVFPIAGDVEPDGDVDFGDFAYFAEHWLLGK